MATYINEVCSAQRSTGPATILAIGTANPPNEFYQADYPDYYFRVTNNEHMTDLKAKFNRICKKSMIRKRHLVLTEEMLKEHPQIIDNNADSLKIRNTIMSTEIPKLGKEAAMKALKEWGQPKSKITHLIVGTNSDVDIPGADITLKKLLGLQPGVSRYLLRLGGCQAGATALRIAKDVVENNRDARVLVVCSESTAICFQPPTSETHLVPSALFGDGAAAVVVGADPNEPAERPIFKLFFTSHTTLPDSDDMIQARLNMFGMVVELRPELPKVIAKHIGKIITESLKHVGINDCNSVFWVAHPGGPAILDGVEAELGLEKSKLSATRKVLSEYGNVLGASVIFIMDEMRKRSLKEGRATTGEGLEWGVLCGFGPGVTVETILLHSVPLPSLN